MKNIVFVICLLCLTLTVKAQYTREDAPVPAPTTTDAPKPTKDTAKSIFWSNVSIGGGFGLQFGDPTLIGLSPLFNYHLLDDVEIGIGPVYQYFSIYDQYGDKYTSTTYGGRITASVFFPGRLSNLFLHGEYDLLNVPDNYSVFTNITRATIGFPLAGIGIKRPLGDRSYYYILFSYNFNNSLLSPYFSNPVMEAGFDFGL